MKGKIKMKCRICGAKLTKEGDICVNCYKKYQEEEDLKKDVNKILELKRKFKLSYEFVKYWELILIFILSAIGCFVFENSLEGILCLLILMAILAFLILIDKKNIKDTRVTFYEKKVVYVSKSCFFNTEKTVKYTDLQNINCFQNGRQKLFGYGDLCVYAKGSIPGATLLNGFQLKDIENAKEVAEQVRGIVKLK